MRLWPSSNVARRTLFAIVVAVGHLAAGGRAAAQQSVPPAAPEAPPAQAAPRMWPKPVPSAPKPAPPRVPLVLTGVTVIDVTDGRLLPGRTVVVLGNRIHRIGSAHTVAVPSGAKVVNATGKYLIPGLWDMHAHIDSRVGWYPMYIADGVTGVREMAQRFPHGTDSFRVWQREVAEGERVGPRAYGPSSDVSNYNGVSFSPDLIKTPEDAPRIIDSLKAAGAIFLKYHGSTEMARFLAILREARRVGLPVVGHIPGGESAAVASDSGMVSIEHINEIHPCFPDPLNLAAPDFAAIEDQCKPVIQTFLRNGTWYTPTLMFFAAQRDYIAFAHEFIRLIHRLGMRRFLAGSDGAMVTRAGDTEPGIPLLQEIILLAGGLTPLEALQSATLNPARFLNGTDSLGTVAEGKLADLVLLDGNPLADIRNILKIRAVVAGGRYFDERALDALNPFGRSYARTLAQDPGRDMPSWVGAPMP